MGMNFYHFANLYGSSTENTKVMIQGLMYLEVKDYYEELVDAIGKKKTHEFMQKAMDFCWEQYLGSFHRRNPIDYGMAVAMGLEEFLEEQLEHPLHDIEKWFDTYFNVARLST